MTRVDLPLLAQQLTAAGVSFNGLGAEDNMLEKVHTWSTDPVVTKIIPLPPEADPVLAAHVAPPLVTEYAGTVQASGVVRTTDAAMHEVFRFPTQTGCVYRATFSIIAVDAGDSTTKDAEARIVFKRPTTGLAQVGTTQVLSTAQDANASTWQIRAQPSGTDLIIGVSGAAGRTIDWILAGTVVTYAPGGLAS